MLRGSADIEFLQLDVTDDALAREAVETVLQRAGRIDLHSVIPRLRGSRWASKLGF